MKKTYKSSQSRGAIFAAQAHARLPHAEEGSCTGNSMAAEDVRYWCCSRRGELAGTADAECVSVCFSMFQLYTVVYC